MTNETFAGRAGRIAGHAWVALRWFWAQLDWELIGDLLVRGLVTFAVLTYLAGRGLGGLVHRANDGMARVAVRLLVPGEVPQAPPVSDPPAPIAEPVLMAAAAAPAAHPLALLADRAAAALEPLTVAELRRLARAAGLPRSLTRGGRREALLTALVGMEVAAA